MLLLLLITFLQPPNLSERLGGARVFDYADVTIGGRTSTQLIYTLPPQPFELRKEIVLGARTSRPQPSGVSPGGAEATADTSRRPGRPPTADETSARPIGLWVSMLSDLDVFWDGKLIGHGGRIDNFYVVDGTPGAHSLLIRARPPRDVRPSYFVYGIAVGDYATMTRSRIVSQVFSLAALGVFLVIGIYFFAMWFAAGRQSSLLVFALLCFAASLLVIAESYRWLFGYPYAWHIVRLQIINALTLVVAFLLPLFFVLELSVPKPRAWAAAIAIPLCAIAMAPITFDTRCLVMFAVGVAASLAAIVRGRRDIPAAIGVLALAAALVSGGGYSFGDRTFFLAFVLLIACLLLSLTLKLRHQQLRAARLEIELLKRSIQPHFLMNTLTAAIEWIEAEPVEGARFLDALASELRILNEISGASSIPISRELELCRSHLTIMSYRKDMRFELETSGIDHAAEIPPAIFHTLIENAISHNRYRDRRIVFTLDATRSNGHRKYVLDTPLSRHRVAPATSPAAFAAESAAPHDGREGLGLRYVKTRLEESFPGGWQLQSEAMEDRWRTTIVVPA
ncbi:MAG TPA: histidine kinase [Thermoanaerobaculia bacterium]|nr:histidine kinase [Thermoanaerobaculia bacterium]